MEAGNDDHLFLEHYVLLGNFMKDPDRFDVFDTLLSEFVREFAMADENGEELSKARNSYDRLLEQARLLRSELARIEQEREEEARRAGEHEESFTRLFRRKTGTVGPARDSETADLQRKAASIEANIEELAPLINAAKQRLEFLTEEYRNRLGDFLNEPSNARRLFDDRVPVRQGEPPADMRMRMLEEWVQRLEEHELLVHVLAGYELRRTPPEYCPPIHLSAVEEGAGESR